jgi:predicted nuclease with TOPRIM domain
MEEKEHKVEFFISNIGGKENPEVVDLNKIFQMNFSYNFDLLKNLMEALMKNQKHFQAELKEKTDKIMELENQISNLRLPSEKTETQKTYKKLEPSSFQQLEINKEQALNPKILSVFQGDKNALQAPPNDIKLEESSNNDDKLNNIIVSIIYIYHINFSI